MAGANPRRALNHHHDDRVRYLGLIHPQRALDQNRHLAALDSAGGEWFEFLHYSAHGSATG